MVVPAGTQHQFVNTGPTPLVCPDSLGPLLRLIMGIASSTIGIVQSSTDYSYANLQILYTIYSPAEHNPQTVHKTKEEGDEEEENGKDEAPAWSRKPQAENEKAGLVNTSGKY